MGMIKQPQSYPQGFGYVESSTSLLLTFVNFFCLESGKSLLKMKKENDSFSFRLGRINFVAATLLKPPK